MDIYLRFYQLYNKKNKMEKCGNTLKMFYWFPKRKTVKTRSLNSFNEKYKKKFVLKYHKFMILYSLKWNESEKFLCYLWEILLNEITYHLTHIFWFENIKFTFFLQDLSNFCYFHKLDLLTVDMLSSSAIVNFNWIEY